MNGAHDVDSQTLRQPRSDQTEESQQLALKLPVPYSGTSARDEEIFRQADVGLRVLGQGVKGEPCEQGPAGERPAAQQVVGACTVFRCEFLIAVTDQVDERVQRYAQGVPILVVFCDRRPVE